MIKNNAKLMRGYFMNAIAINNGYAIFLRDEYYLKCLELADDKYQFALYLMKRYIGDWGK